MGKALPIVFGVVLLVYTVFDLIATPSSQVRILPKPLWFVLLLLPFVGPLLWMFIGRAKPVDPPKPATGGGWSPPSAPRGPDDDPDYLRKL